MRGYTRHGRHRTPLVTGGEGGSAETREFDTQHDFAKPTQQQQLQKTASQLPPTAENNWCYDGRFLRSARVKLLILHPIYLKHPVDMATALLLHCCCCTPHIIRYLQISACPQNVMVPRAHYAITSRVAVCLVFSLDSVSQNTVIIIVRPPVQRWA